MLTVEEAQRLLSVLAVKERTMVLMALGTGLRRSELFALKWKDVDFTAEHISVTRSIVNQVVGTCKTEASQKPVPLHSALAHALLVWRRQTGMDILDGGMLARAVTYGVASLSAAGWPGNTACDEACSCGGRRMESVVQTRPGTGPWRG